MCIALNVCQRGSSPTRVIWLRHTCLKNVVLN